jgi:hypothetical protein
MLRRLSTAIFILLFSYPSFASGTTLLLPPRLQAGSSEAVESLALALAVHDQLAKEQQLIPFTAVRKKLESMNLPISGPITLASQFRVAEFLSGIKILQLHETEQQVVVNSYDVAARFLLSRYAEPREQVAFAEMVRMMMSDLTAEPVALDESRVAYYRVWASAYLAPDRQTMQEIMDRLLQTPFANDLLMREYVDLFGDPSEAAEEPDDLAYWRDFFSQRNYYQGALRTSARVLDARHNPADLIVHARILLALEAFEEACTFLREAESFGFDLGDLQARFEACDGQP